MPLVCFKCGNPIHPEFPIWSASKPAVRVCGFCKSREIMKMTLKLISPNKSTTTKEKIMATTKKTERKGQRYYVIEDGHPRDYSKEQIATMANNRFGPDAVGPMPPVYFGRLTGPIDVTVTQPDPVVSITVPELKRDKPPTPPKPSS